MSVLKSISIFMMVFSLGIIALPQSAQADDTDILRMRAAGSYGGQADGALGLLLLFGAIADGATRNRSRRERLERENQEERSTDASDVLSEGVYYDDHNEVCIAYEDIPVDEQVCEMDYSSSDI